MGHSKTTYNKQQQTISGTGGFNKPKWSRAQSEFESVNHLKNSYHQTISNFPSVAKKVSLPNMAGKSGFGAINMTQTGFDFGKKISIGMGQVTPDPILFQTPD